MVNGMTSHFKILIIVVKILIIIDVNIPMTVTLIHQFIALIYKYKSKQLESMSIFLQMPSPAFCNNLSSL